MKIKAYSYFKLSDDKYNLNILNPMLILYYAFYLK